MRILALARASVAALLCGSLADQEHLRVVNSVHELRDILRLLSEDLVVIDLAMLPDARVAIDLAREHGGHAAAVPLERCADNGPQ